MIKYRPTGIRLDARSGDKANLYGPANTRTYGTITHADTFGTDLCMRSAAPPPVEEYNAYLAGRNVRSTNFLHRVSKSGTKLRRIVIMRREGSSWKECGEAVGVSGGVAKDWVAMLPRELAI